MVGGGPASRAESDQFNVTLLGQNGNRTKWNYFCGLSSRLVENQAEAAHQLADWVEGGQIVYGYFVQVSD